MQTRKMTIIAMLIALYEVFSIISPIKVINFHLTFEAFPVLIGGLLFGPVAGMCVGGLGSLIYQVLFSGYGITATTLLWILPHFASGLLVGLYGKLKNYKYEKFDIILIACLSAITVTSLNTVALYVDSKLYGYYSSKLVFGSILIKVVTGIGLATLYSLALPHIIKMLTKD